MNFKDDKDFIKDWNKKVAQGYKYGKDALESVYFGWSMRSDEVHTLENNWDSDMTFARTQLQMASQLLTAKKELLEALAENARLQEFIQRAFAAHPNLDIDVQNVS